MISCCASFCVSGLIDRFVKNTAWAMDLDDRMNRAVHKIAMRCGISR